MSTTFIPAAMDALNARDTEFVRPDFERQRSKSAPEFPLLDVTASETIIICSAAASASERRRRGRQNRRYASLDFDADSTLPRPTQETLEPASEPDHPATIVEQDEAPEAKTPMNAYAQSMASFMQKQIEAVQRHSISSARQSTLYCQTEREPGYYDVVYGDDDDDDLDEEAHENVEVSELRQAYAQPITKAPVRPVLKSAFSAWSTATSSPIEENFTFFDFPEPPQSNTDETRDAEAHVGTPLPPCDSPMSSQNNFYFSSSNASTPDTPRCPRSQSNNEASVEQDKNDSYFPAKFPSPVSLSTPIYTPTQQNYFDTQKTSFARRPSAPPTRSSFDAFTFPTRVHQKLACMPVQAPQRYTVEGQIFEICH